jgi:2-haloacid dehalogenase
MRLADFRALSFDCYGTLIDWESGLREALAPLARRSGRTVDESMLALFGSLETAVQKADPRALYPQVLAEVHRRLAEHWQVEADPAEHRAFGRSIGDWPAFPDSAAALAYLHRHFRLVILSNVDKASFALSERRLGTKFDHVFTAEEIGAYKPDPRNFHFLVDRLGAEGIGRNEILHVAQSLYHDHVPANVLGLASAWIDRRGGAGGGATAPVDVPVRYDFRFESLEELAEAHRAELARA